MGNIKWVQVIVAFTLGAVVAPKIIAWTGGRLPQVGR